MGSIASFKATAVRNEYRGLDDLIVNEEDIEKICDATQAAYTFAMRTTQEYIKSRAGSWEFVGFMDPCANNPGYLFLYEDDSIVFMPNPEGNRAYNTSVVKGRHNLALARAALGITPPVSDTEAE